MALSLWKMVHESRRMLSEFPSADAKLTDMSGLNSPATTAISDELKGAGKVSVIVVNPKNSDERTKPLLEDALVLYNTELPSLSYAANTGKESRFLKNCVTNGKYRTLLLKDHVLDGTNNVIAAITFQIIPADTQYAEIPVAAVRKDYQRKGLGTILYRELHMRLQDVGVLAIFCWGDLESEPFWAKQGFLKIAEIDDRGRPKNFA